MIIHLTDLEFFAHHGLHDEEAITGTNFKVSVSISFEPVGKITAIHETINYVAAYQIIDKHMIKPVALLEILAQNIVDDLHLMDDRINNINISINKIHPPIPNFIGRVGVTFHKAFSR